MIRHVFIPAAVGYTQTLPILPFKQIIAKLFDVNIVLGHSILTFI